MFSPGETVIHKFVIPFNVDDIDYVVVSYEKNEDIILEKRITTEFKQEENGITSFDVELSQAESLLFDDNGCFTMQLNVLTKNFGRHTSLVMESKNNTQYLKEVMNSGQ